MSEFKSSDKMPVVVVLDDVRSLHNVGSVFRTADAFAVEKLFLCGITACPPHREIEKTALGATESVQWEYRENVLHVLEDLIAADYIIFGIEQVEGSVELHSFIPENDRKIAIVFGNEVKGVSQKALNMCNGFLEIPQTGTKHSLNISVAAGIVMWALYRQFGV